LVLVFYGLSSAQDEKPENYQYISPLPDSKLILPESNIIIRQGDKIDASTVKEEVIEVTGSLSGVHKGEFVLSDDMRTLIFIPSVHFTPGEKVNVKFNCGIYTINNELLFPLNFRFHISKTISENIRDKILNDVSDFVNAGTGTKHDPRILNRNEEVNDGLPEDFPNISVKVKNDPVHNYIFWAPSTINTPSFGYLTIIDNNGVPVYYKRFPSRIYDFKVQNNGLLTYSDIINNQFFAVDSSYAIVDSFSTGNGYTTDYHDFQIMPNGHYLLIAYDPQPVRMDTVVAGGDSTAIVIGLILQELDLDKNVVFQWRSWDHFQITDATEDIDLTQHTIDYVHGNAIELDFDGNLLISCRHMDEITKIDRQTGEIIWRWGGLKSKNNQFQFINDSITFSHQHDIRRLQNGNLTLYDNGNLHTPRISRAREYKIDESNLMAELLWAHSHQPPIYKSGLGNVQTITGNNKLIGWGGWANQGAEAISEIHKDGSTALEILLDESFINYRAFKFPWKTNLFVTKPDSIFFESIPVGDSATISIELINNSANPVIISGYYNLDSNFVVENPVPFTLAPHGIIPINIKFVPKKEGYFIDYLHIRSDTNTSRIAQVMVLAGRTDSTFSSVNDQDEINNYKIEQNYPNPFNPSTTIRYSLPKQSQVKIQIYNLIGENIALLVNRNQNAGSYEVTWDAENSASGIYFYSIKAIPTGGSDFFQSVKKMIILK
jgi:hypothetical protein